MVSSANPFNSSGKSQLTNAVGCQVICWTKPGAACIPEVFMENGEKKCKPLQ